MHQADVGAHTVEYVREDGVWESANWESANREHGRDNPCGLPRGGQLRKLKILLATLAMTLLMASPALAADLIVNIGGSVCTNCTINSNNDTTTNEENTTVDDQSAILEL